MCWLLDPIASRPLEADSSKADTLSTDVSEEQIPSAHGRTHRWPAFHLFSPNPLLLDPDLGFQLLPKGLQTKAQALVAEPLKKGSGWWPRVDDPPDPRDAFWCLGSWFRYWHWATVQIVGHGSCNVMEGREMFVLPFQRTNPTKQTLGKAKIFIIFKLLHSLEIAGPVLVHKTQHAYVFKSGICLHRICLVHSRMLSL